MAQITVTTESFTDAVKSQRNAALDRLAAARAQIKALEGALIERGNVVEAQSKIVAEQDRQLREAAAKIGALNGELATFKNPPQDSTGS